MTVLTALPYSPWSEKATWALDHHRIDYKYDEHMPLVGDIKLRWRLRKPKGIVTVPVLEDGGRFFTDTSGKPSGGSTMTTPASRSNDGTNWSTIGTIRSTSSSLPGAAGA